jgi:predicted HTH transcriptional regulator
MALIRKPNHLQTLINKGEGIDLDFKYAVNDSKKIARSLSAFANSQGGVLLLGVRDNGSIAGVKSEEEFYMIETAAKFYTRPEVFIEVKPHTASGLTVLEIIIPKSKEIPHLSPDGEGKWKAYVRVKDENIVADKIQMLVWKLQKSENPIKITYSKNEKILLNFLSNHETISFSHFCRLAEISRFQAENILANLIVLKIITFDIDKTKKLFSLSNID